MDRSNGLEDQARGGRRRVMVMVAFAAPLIAAGTVLAAKRWNDQRSEKEQARRELSSIASREARLAAEGEWQRLKELQDSLKAGVPAG